MNRKERAARADLKRKVRELLKNNSTHAMKVLDQLMVDSDIAANHEKDGGYAAPKDFLVAFGREMQWLWGKPYAEDRRWAKRVKRYWEQMKRFF